jgi:hypothetical protein
MTIVGRQPVALAAVMMHRVLAASVVYSSNETAHTGSSGHFSTAESLQQQCSSFSLRRTIVFVFVEASRVVSESYLADGEIYVSAIGANKEEVICMNIYIYIYIYIYNVYIYIVICILHKILDYIL